MMHFQCRNIVNILFTALSMCCANRAPRVLVKSRLREQLGSGGVYHLRDRANSLAQRDAAQPELPSRLNEVGYPFPARR
jgi:hypothetical protein